MESPTQSSVSEGWKPQPSKKPKARKANNIASKLDRRKASPSTFSKFKVISKGLAIGWRMNQSGTGTWTARRMGENGKYDPLHVIGASDEARASDGINVFDYDQAVAAAIAWDKQREAEESGHIVATGSYTVQETVEDYLKAKELEKRKPLQRDRATAKAHIYPALGHVELRKLTHQQVRGWHQTLAQTPAKARTRAGAAQRYRKPVGSDAEALQARQSTANRCLTVLKAALNYAKQETRRIGTDAGWVDVKPFKNADRKRERFLTLDESKNLVNACDVHFGKLVQGALYTGGRYSELTHLRVKDFNAADGSIFIAKSKSGLERTIYLGPEAIEFFKGMVLDRKPTETMFTKADGTAFKQSEQQRPMDKACDEAKIDNFTFHGLRHTFASQYRIAGGPLDVLKDILGHADLRMTMRYAKIGKSHLQEQSHRYAPAFGLMLTGKAGE